MRLLTTAAILLSFEQAQALYTNTTISLHHHPYQPSPSSYSSSGPWPPYALVQNKTAYTSTSQTSSTRELATTHTPSAHDSTTSPLRNGTAQRSEDRVSPTSRPASTGGTELNPYMPPTSSAFASPARHSDSQISYASNSTLTSAPFSQANTTKSPFSNTTSDSQQVTKNNSVLLNFDTVVYGKPDTPYTTLCDSMPRAHGSYNIISTGLKSRTAPRTTTTSTSSVFSDSDCQITGDHVRLYYWPVETEAANPCSGPSTIQKRDVLGYHGQREGVVEIKEMSTDQTHGDVVAWEQGDDLHGANWQPGENRAGQKTVDRPHGHGQRSRPPTSQISGQPSSTITPPPMLPVVNATFGRNKNVATFGSIKVTSPDVFLSINFLGASMRKFDQSNGNPMNFTMSFTDIAVIIPTDALSSIIETRTGMDWKQIAKTKYGEGFASPLALTSRSYNLADLNGPVPAEPYFLAPNPVLSSLKSAGQIFSPGLLTMYDDYSPFVSIPTAIRTMDSRLVSCNAAIQGLYDPPTALSSASFTVISTNKLPIRPPDQTPVPGSGPPTPFVSLTPVSLPSSSTKIAVATSSQNSSPNAEASNVEQPQRPPPANSPPSSSGQPTSSPSSSNQNFPHVEQPQIPSNIPEDDVSVVPLTNPSSQASSPGGPINPEPDDAKPLALSTPASDDLATSGQATAPSSGTQASMPNTSLPGLGNDVWPSPPPEQLWPTATAPKKTSVPSANIASQAIAAWVTNAMSSGTAPPSSNETPSHSAQIGPQRSTQQPYRAEETAGNLFSPTLNDELQSNEPTRTGDLVTTSPGRPEVESRPVFAPEGATQRTSNDDSPIQDQDQDQADPIGTFVSMKTFSQDFPPESWPTIHVLPAPLAAPGITSHDADGTASGPAISGLALKPNRQTVAAHPNKATSVDLSPTHSLPEEGARTVAAILGTSTLAIPIPIPPSITDSGVNPPITADETISAGGTPLVIGTNTMSIASNGWLVLDGHAVNPTTSPTPTITGYANIVVASAAEAITPGAAPSTIGMHEISRDAGGNYIMDSTSSFTAASALATALSADAIAIEFDSSVLNAVAAITIGAPASIFGGHIISHGSNGAYMVDGSLDFTGAAAAATALESQAKITAVSNAAASITAAGPGTQIGSHAVSRASNGVYIVDSTATFPDINALATALGPGLDNIAFGRIVDKVNSPYTNITTPVNTSASTMATSAPFSPSMREYVSAQSAPSLFASATLAKSKGSNESLAARQNLESYESLFVRLLITTVMIMFF